MEQEIFELVGLIACPSDVSGSSSKVACSRSCLATAHCNGFIWRPDTKQCKLVRLLLGSTATGPCHYYLRHYLKNASERCPGYNISVPSSPDRVYRIFMTKITDGDVESFCNTFRGVTAEMEKGNSLDEMFSFMAQVVFQDSSWFEKCDHFASDNIQCKIAMAVSQESPGVYRWKRSRQEFDPYKYSFFPEKSNMMMFTVKLNYTGHLMERMIKFDENSLRFPFCQCS